MVVACSFIGIAFAIDAVRSEDARMRNQAITEAKLMERAVDWAAVRALRGDSSDLSRKEYLKLKRQFETLRSIRPEYRFVYLMQFRDGRVRFLLDAEPPDSPDFSPPGMPYEEATKDLIALFSGGTPFTEGPMEDRWGIWVSALVPHSDSGDEAPVAVLGVDIDARQWRGALIQAAALPLGSTLALAIVAGFLFVLHSRAIRENQRLLESEERLYAQAHHDPLTGLPNARMLLERMSQTLSLSRRGASRASVLFLDLDRFKNVNDSFGHAMGDALLKTVSDRLRAIVREEDTVARLGGDEFVILIPELRRNDDARRVAAKIIEEIAKPVIVDGNPLSVGVSIGIATYPDDAEDVDSWLAAADRAMYAAKDGGRNNFQFADPQQNAQARSRLAMETGLRQGLAKGEFELAYQPAISLSDGSISCVEAVVRWRRPDQNTGKTLEPAEFLPIAEDSGLIIPLGEWVLAEACQAAARWRLAGAAGVPVIVNISSIQLRRPEFEAHVITALQVADLPPSLLELDLNEAAIMQERHVSSHLLERIAKQGVRLAIDDFGAGYSSLSHLRGIAVSRLKIDKEFISEIDRDQKAANLVESIIGIVRALGVSVTAEGVERESQAETLRRFGCDHAQGYLFCEPLSEASLLARLPSATSSS